jgi:hypothetical protein
VIGVIDNTTGVQWATKQSYAGPADSVEWIVEAPLEFGSQTTLGAYSPAVTFTGLGIGGTQGPLTRLEMTQNGQIVSIPSDESNDSFAVAYGSQAPPTP